jgi:hypothetical protein
MSGGALLGKLPHRDPVPADRTVPGIVRRRSFRTRVGTTSHPPLGQKPPRAKNSRGMMERGNTQLILTHRETAARRCVQSYLVIITAGIASVGCAPRWSFSTSCPNRMNFRSPTGTGDHLVTGLRASWEAINHSNVRLPGLFTALMRPRVHRYGAELLAL